MVRMSAEWDDRDLQKKLKAIRSNIGQLPTTLYSSLLFNIRQQMQATLPNHIHKPKPYTIRGIRYKVTPNVAVIFIAPEVAEYLLPIIKGGVTENKIRPFPAYKDQYGNLRRSLFRKAGKITSSGVVMKKKGKGYMPVGVVKRKVTRRQYNFRDHALNSFSAVYDKTIAKEAFIEFMKEQVRG